MKTNTISLISVRIRFVYIPAAAAEGEPWWAAAAWVHGPSDSMVESGICTGPLSVLSHFWHSTCFDSLPVSNPWQQWRPLHVITGALIMYQPSPC